MSKFFNNIVVHRKKINPIRGLDYANHTPNAIHITLPETVIKEYENDYAEMIKFMIYGEALTFDALIKRISELQTRTNGIIQP